MTPPQTPWQKAAEQVAPKQSGTVVTLSKERITTIIEQACKDYAWQLAIETNGLRDKLAAIFSSGLTDHASHLEKENAELKAQVEKMRAPCFLMCEAALASHPTLEFRKLPDPTPEQAACKHEKWKKATHPPRVCIECGLQMWDAGD